MSKPISAGGQALIEGIMMKSPLKTAIAVRTPDKTIDIEYIKEKHLKDRYSVFGLPIIRGVVNFIESMLLGYKALMHSADKSGMTELEEAEKEKKENSKLSNTVLGIVMVIGVVLGVALSVFLFMYMPAFLFDILKRLTANGVGEGFRPLFEGVLKIAIFIIYLALVSTTKDIKRVFMYHGAEHKTIFCYEHGQELTIENVKKESRFHPRCGTSFMILMLIVGILISFLVMTIFPPEITKIRWLWVAIKILIVPLICGIGYELIKICGKYENPVTKIIAAPGLWVQRLTTKEPEDDMIEVAIAALKAVLPDQETPLEEPKQVEN